LSTPGSAAQREARRRWKLANLDRTREHAQAMHAVERERRAGRLIPDPCGQCGSPAVEAHHPRGYAPEHHLDIVWLCRAHHLSAHSSRNHPGDIESH